MATTGTGTAGFENAIQIYYIRRLLTRLEQATRLDQFGKKQELPKHEGNEVKWTRYNNFAAVTAALTEGVSPTSQTLQSTQITAIPLQYGAFVEVTDFLIDEALDPVVENSVDVLAYQAALSMDTIIRNTLHANLTDQFAGVGPAEINITQTDVLNADEIRKAVTTLKNADVQPMADGNFASVIHPSSGFDLLSDTQSNGWMELNKYTNINTALKNEVGKLYGTRFVESSNIERGANGAGGVFTYRNFMFGMECYGLVNLAGHNTKIIRKQLGSAGTADPLDQRATVGYKFSHVTKVLDDVRGIEMYAASAFDA